MKGLIMRKKTVLLFMLFAIMCILAACQHTESVPMKSIEAQNVKTSEAVNTVTADRPMEQTGVVSEDEDNCVTILTDRLESYLDLAELDANADIVFTGECVAAEPKFQNETLYTISRIKVEQVYKGDISKGDVLLFCEFGGRVTNGEYNKGCNLPPIPKSAEASADKQIVVGADGYYPFKAGEKALLFARDVGGYFIDIDEPQYGVVGGYDGKLFLQEDGSYKKPLPSEMDTGIIIEVIITIDQLNEQYK